MLYLEILHSLAILAGLVMIIVGQSPQHSWMWGIGGIGLIGLVIVPAMVSAVLRARESKAPATPEGNGSASE
jgi:hypothetical protein